jgi:hypothetical protein
MTHFSIRCIPGIRFTPRYYILFIRFLKVKKLLNNPPSYPASPSNYNSLGTSVLNKASRNKEIIKVNVIARALRRLR